MPLNPPLAPLAVLSSRPVSVNSARPKVSTPPPTPNPFRFAGPMATARLPLIVLRVAVKPLFA